MKRAMKICLNRRTMKLCLLNPKTGHWKTLLLIKTLKLITLMKPTNKRNKENKKNNYKNQIHLLSPMDLKMLNHIDLKSFLDLWNLFQKKQNKVKKMIKKKYSTNQGEVTQRTTTIINRRRKMKNLIRGLKL